MGKKNAQETPDSRSSFLFLLLEISGYPIVTLEYLWEIEKGQFFFSYKMFMMVFQTKLIL